MKPAAAAIAPGNPAPSVLKDKQTRHTPLQSQVTLWDGPVLVNAEVYLPFLASCSGLRMKSQNAQNGENEALKPCMFVALDYEVPVWGMVTQVVAGPLCPMSMQMF
jgi:hypothetical protein